MIPDDLDPIFREIDDELKAEGVKPYQRPMHAVKKFGNRFGVSLPMVSSREPMPEGFGIPKEVMENAKYTNALHAWYTAEYGQRLSMDPSDWRCVACFADGDIWEVGLPILRGVTVYYDRKLQPERKPSISTGGATHNVCNSLRGITQQRLNRFSDEDVHEVWAMFMIGMDATKSIQDFGRANNYFEQCPADLSASFVGLTAQHPNYGQSRYAAMMLVEHFMKGLLAVIRQKKPPHGHDIRELHKFLKAYVPNLDLSHLFDDLHCTAAARYGEVETTREEAYAAQKAALLAIRALGSIKKSD